MNFNINNSFWSYIGKLAALFTVIWISIQIYGQFSYNEHKLRSVAYKYDLILPTNIKSNFDWRGMHIIRDSIYNYTKNNIDLFDDFEQINSIIDLFASYYHIENHSIFDKSTIFVFNIENTGTTEVSDINLEIPFNGIYEIHQPGNQNRIGSHQGFFIV